MSKNNELQNYSRTEKNLLYDNCFAVLEWFAIERRKIKTRTITYQLDDSAKSQAVVKLTKTKTETKTKVIN